jgi:hypothetical protein
MAAALQVLMALAAISWLCFLTAALTIGVRIAVKIRSRRRRIKRVIKAFRLQGLVSERMVVRSLATAKALGPQRMRP